MTFFLYGPPLRLVGLRLPVARFLAPAPFFGLPAIITPCLIKSPLTTLTAEETRVSSLFLADSQHLICLK